MSAVSIVIAILSISVCILLAIVAYNKATRWISVLVVPMLCVAAYLGWTSAEDLKGKPTKNLYTENAMLLGSSASPPQWIYVWIQPLDTSEPLLMSIPFTERLAKQMAQANKDMCEGKPQGVKGIPRKGDPSTDEDAEEQGQGNSPTLEVYDFNILVRPMK